MFLSRGEYAIGENGTVKLCVDHFRTDYDNMFDNCNIIIRDITPRQLILYSSNRFPSTLQDIKIDFIIYAKE